MSAVLDALFGQQPEWMARGLCRQLDPETFFATTELEVESAKLICSTCPEQADCLDYALVNHEQGVWGGTDEADRRLIRKARGIGRRFKPVRHGTPAGYRRGCRLPCCQIAHAVARTDTMRRSA